MAISRSSLRNLALFAALLGCSLAAYGPALSGRFLWDDGGHVTRPDLRSADGLVRIWTQIGATQQYYPVLHTAFWIEHRIWGDAVVGYHLLNVLLHATAAFLVARLVRGLFGRRYPGAGAIAAFLFALHPVCVESVAWISEQKNTLSAVFYLAAGGVYLRWRGAENAARGAGGGRRGAPSQPSYVLATVCFLLALLTKSVTATLPAALLVAAWWRRGRLSWRKDVAPLLPWFAIALAMGLVTSRVEHRLIGAVGAEFSLDPLQRLLLASRALWFYACKLLWPNGLTFIYPKWTIDPSDPAQYAPLAGCLVAAATLLWAWRRLGVRGPLAAAAYFAGTLFPALGFIDAYPFRYSYVADHFQYLACLGILVPLAAGVAWFLDRPARAAAIPAVGRALRVLPLAALLLILGSLTRSQSGMYRDGFRLYEATLRRNPGCWMAEGNLGTALVDAGRTAEALPHFERALQLNPAGFEAENSLGDALNRLGRPADAIPHLERVIRSQPAFAEAHNNLGVSLMMMDRPLEGTEEFEEAVRWKPGFALAHVNLGLALAQAGRTQEALENFELAARLDPGDALAELEWAAALTALRRPAEAMVHYERALRLNPHSADAHRMYSFALKELGRFQEGDEQDALARQEAASSGP